MSQPPDHRAVRDRLGALATYAGLALQLGPPERLTIALEQMSDSNRSAVRRQLDEGPVQVRAQLIAAGVWSAFSPSEQAYLSTPADRVTAQDWSTAMLHIEGVAVLLWALGIVDTLPSYEGATTPEIMSHLKDGLPVATTLKASKDIKRARDIAELWHWRARARLFASDAIPAPLGMSGDAFEKPVAQAAERAAADGVISHVLKGDFPIGNQPYASLPTSDVMRLAATAYGRHWALNWLCGHAPDNQWDETPTGT